VFVVLLNVFSDNLLRIQTNVWLKILIATIGISEGVQPHLPSDPR